MASLLASLGAAFLPKALSFAKAGIGSFINNIVTPFISDKITTIGNKVGIPNTIG